MPVLCFCVCFVRLSIKSRSDLGVAVAVSLCSSVRFCHGQTEHRAVPATHDTACRSFAHSVTHSFSAGAIPSTTATTGPCLDKRGGVGSSSSRASAETGSSSDSDGENRATPHEKVIGLRRGRVVRALRRSSELLYPSYLRATNTPYSGKNTSGLFSLCSGYIIGHAHDRIPVTLDDGTHGSRRRRHHHRSDHGGEIPIDVYRRVTRNVRPTDGKFQRLSLGQVRESTYRTEFHHSSRLTLSTVLVTHHGLIFVLVVITQY